jgi:CBS domain-containing protein
VTAVLDRVGRSDEGQVLVIDSGKLVGLLSPTDITRVLATARH